MLAVIAAVNSVIAFFYYSNVIRVDVVQRARRPKSGRASIRVPPALARRDRDHRRGDGRRRHLPAGLRAGRRARVLITVSAADVRSPARIHREGPIPFDVFIEPRCTNPTPDSSRAVAARVAPDAISSPARGRLPVRRVRGAGHRPHGGTTLGRPDPFLVVEAGAGTGRLAREVRRAEPACLRALRYVLVERSPALRAAPARGPRARAGRRSARPVRGARRGRAEPVAAGRGPVFVALDEMPAIAARRRRDRQRAARQPAVRHRGVGRHALARSARRASTARARRDARARGRGRRRCAGASHRRPHPSGRDAASDPARHQQWLDDVRPRLAPRRRDAGRLHRSTSTSCSRAAPIGCAPTERTDAAATRSTIPANQDITADVVREQLELAALAAGFSHRRATRARPSGCATSASTTSSPKAGARGTTARHRGDLDALAGRSRVDEARGADRPRRARRPSGRHVDQARLGPSRRHR